MPAANRHSSANRKEGREQAAHASLERDAWHFSESNVLVRRSLYRPRWPACAIDRHADRSLPPMAIAPRQQPMRAGCDFSWNRVEARAAPGVATADPRQAHEAAGPKSVPGDGFIGIVGARRQITAMAADQSRKTELVGANEKMRHAARPQPQTGEGRSAAGTGRRHDARRDTVSLAMLKLHISAPDWAGLRWQSRGRTDLARRQQLGQNARSKSGT